MTSSSIASGIQRLQARLMAENKPRDRESIGGLMDSTLKSNSRHGSGHRPRKLGEMPASTSSRNRTQLALPVNQMSPRNRDSAETDQKLREIMKQSGMLMINGVKYQTDVKDMEHLGELGNGTCGHVVKMRHKPSGEVIAVKQMRRTCNSEENKRIVMDIDVVYKSYDCPYIVQCLGCIIMESEVWICMELMATCFDKLLKRLKAPVPEEILGKVTVATVKALSYLKDKHDLIHRDVKPSNILLSEKGNVKLCDFGISGRLVDSKAKTKSAGCAAYMAPERIDPPDPMKPDYDIRADVWSLGITLVELALGTFPYQDCSTEFEVVCRIMNDNPPSLPSEKGFSEEFKSFVNCCLTKNYQDRPKYAKLLKHPFIKKYEVIEVAVDQWFAKIMMEMDSPKSAPIVINKSASVLSPVSRRLTATPPSPSARRNQPSIQHFESSSSNVQQLTNGASTMVTTQQFDTFLPTTNDRVTNAALPPDGRTSYIYKSSATTTTSSIPISINYQSQHTERKSPPERLGVTNPTPESAGRFSPFHQRRHLEYDRCTSQSPPNFHDSGGRFSPFGQRRVTDSSIPPHPQDGRYSPFQQRRLTEGSSPLSLSPYQQRRTLNDRLVGDGFWQTPIGSPLPVRKKYQNIPTVEPQNVNCNIGNTSPIVLQRFYHQQNQLQKEQLNKEQISREHHSPHYYSYPINSQGSSDVESSCKEDQGKKRFASYIKLQLGSDRRRTQSPDPPPRLSRGQNAGGDSGQSPLSMRRTLLEAACTGSPNLSRRYISPSPPQPPPRKLTESSSVPGSPQHVRARFHYTPEPQRRLYRNDLS